MPDTVTELVARGKALSKQDRTLLVELLRESLDEPVDAQVEDDWHQALRDRIGAYERGEAILHDADEVIAEATRLTR